MWGKIESDANGLCKNDYMHVPNNPGTSFSGNKEPLRDASHGRQGFGSIFHWFETKSINIDCDNMHVPKTHRDVTDVSVSRHKNVAWCFTPLPGICFRYPVRCAHNPPPCRLYLNAILSSKVWLSDFFCSFPRSGRSIFWCFSRPGPSFSSPGANSDDFWSHCQISLKKVSSSTPQKSLDFETFCDLFFKRFFWVLSFWDFWAFGCPETPF